MKPIYLILIILASCTKGINEYSFEGGLKQSYPKIDTVKVMSVIIITGSGTDDLGNIANCWQIWIRFDKEVNDSIDVNIRWACEAANMGYAAHFIGNANRKTLTHTTHSIADPLWIANYIELISISAEGYYFKL